MACRDCKHYDLPAVLNKAGRVQQNWAARCLWKWPSIVLPLALTRGNKVFLPQPSHMEPNDGVGCPAFEQR